MLLRRPNRAALWLIVPALLAGLSVASCASLHRGRGAKSHGPATAPAAASAPALATLVVHVTDLRNAQGNLIFGVYASPDGFPANNDKAVVYRIRPAHGNAIKFTVQLPPGTYAASVLHDENRNGQMDTNFLGIPTEGYGVTNNPKPKFGAATFEQGKFTLSPEGAELTISLQYF